MNDVGEWAERVAVASADVWTNAVDAVAADGGLSIQTAKSVELQWQLRAIEFDSLSVRSWPVSDQLRRP